MNRKLVLKSPRFVPFGADLAKFEFESGISGLAPRCLRVGVGWLAESRSLHENIKAGARGGVIKSRGPEPRVRVEWQRCRKLVKNWE